MTFLCVSLAQASAWPRAATGCLLALLVAFTGFTTDAVQAADRHGWPDLEAASVAVDVFIGPDFAEFWWDAAQIPNCASVLIHRDSQPLTTVPCSAQPWRDSNLEANRAYTYRFYFMDAEDKTLPPLLGVGALVTPGAYAGTLHTVQTIGGTTAQAGLIRLVSGARLTIDNGVKVVGGTIEDDAGRQDTTCSGEAGIVAASAATFQDTVFHLCNPASNLAGNAGNAAVFLFAPATVKDNALGSVYANIATGSQAVLEGNTFPTGSVDVDGQSDVRIRDCVFQQGGVKFRGESTGVVEDSTFDSSALHPVELTTNRDVTVRSNAITVKSTESGAAAVYLDPVKATGPVPQFSISFNTLIGSDGGAGIRLSPATSGRGDASLSIVQNTISRFAQGVALDDGCISDLRIAAEIQDNSIVNSSDTGVFTRLCGSEDSVSLTGNCLADNTRAIYCSNPDTVVDATGNYWGHKDGPRHSSNPGGQGDLVYCKEEQIDFSYWLQSHVCTVTGLEIAGIEAVQSVQTLSNTVPLVENKPTVVRVYPGVAGGVASNVTGELTGFRDGAQLGTLQNSTAVRAGVIDDWNAVRGDATSSLNFVLPQSWLKGTVDLVATLGADVQSSAVTSEIAALELSIGFSPRQKLKIAYIPVTVDAGARVYPVNAGDILDLHRAITAIYPLGDVEIKILPEATIFYDALPLDDSGNATGSGFVHYSRQVKAFAQQHSGYKADLYITVNGMSGDTFAMDAHKNDLSVGQCSVAEEGRGCLYLFGLNMGLRALRKSDLDSVAFGQPLYAWPYPDAMTHEYGYDVSSGTVKPPGYWDVMSQQAAMERLSSWISPFHYQRAFGNLDPNSGGLEKAQVQSAAGTALWVTGVAGKQSGHLYPVMHVDGPSPDVTPENPGGAYCVQAIGSGESVLDAYCFDLNLENAFTGEAEGNAAFGALLAPVTGVQAIRLRYAGSTLAQLDVPSVPPSISLQSANFVPTYKAVDIAWTVTSGDAAKLRYTFFYSTDGGATWQTLAVHPDRINWVDGAFHWGVRGSRFRPATRRACVSRRRTAFTRRR